MSEKKETCSKCNGKGTHDCPHCSGKDETANGSPCNNCNGTGTVNCQSCNGTCKTDKLKK